MQKSETIITNDYIVDTLMNLTTLNEGTIDSCIAILNQIKDSKKVSESNFKSLTNVVKELEALREVFFIKLLNSLKRGNMIVG